MPDRLTQLEQMLATDPKDPFCLYGLAQEHAKLGDFATAIEFYDRTIEVDPLYCYAYFHKARAQEQQGDVNGATETLRAGLAQARIAADDQAAGEIAGYLESLE